jgi:hypothetical protein
MEQRVAMDVAESAVWLPGNWSLTVKLLVSFGLLAVLTVSLLDLFCVFDLQGLC